MTRKYKKILEKNEAVSNMKEKAPHLWKKIIEQLLDNDENVKEK